MNSVHVNGYQVDLFHSQQTFPSNQRGCCERLCALTGVYKVWSPLPLSISLLPVLNPFRPLRPQFTVGLCLPLNSHPIGFWNWRYYRRLYLRSVLKGRNQLCRRREQLTREPLRFRMHWIPNFPDLKRSNGIIHIHLTLDNVTTFRKRWRIHICSLIK